MVLVWVESSVGLIRFVLARNMGLGCFCWFQAFVLFVCATCKICSEKILVCERKGYFMGSEEDASEVKPGQKIQYLIPLNFLFGEHTAHATAEMVHWNKSEVP